MIDLVESSIRQGESLLAILLFSKIQEHHDALRMTFKMEAGKTIQVNQGNSMPLALEVHDFRAHPNATQELTATAKELQGSIDLEKGPLMKLALIHLDQGDRLLIVIHHLVIDGISWRILFEDIETLFRKFENGEPLSLPLKSDSFKDWALRLSQYADSPAFLEQKEYWSSLASTMRRRCTRQWTGASSGSLLSPLIMTMSGFN